MSGHAQVVARLCRRLAPRHILLIGAMDEATSRSLAAEALVHDATLHVVTAQPPAWIAGVREQLADRCIVHQARVTDAVGIVPLPDLVLVDDDRNWFTTHGVLDALSMRAERLGRPFPPTLIAGAGWPDARRDSYADPGAIPEAYRGAHARAGIVPWRQAPGADGLFGDRFNGVAENEPGRGVLTALEDFLSGRTQHLRLTMLPGFGGVAALCSRTGPGAELFAPADLAADMTAMAKALERVRLEQAVQLAESAASLRRAEALAAKLSARAMDAQRTVSATIAPATAQEPLLSDQPLSAIARTVASRAKRRLGSLVQRAQHARSGDADVEQPDLEKEAFERLRASCLFDPAWYLATYEDVAAAGADPALHYLRDGAAEMRDPSAYFSTGYYLTAYPDVAAEKLNPLLHYLQHGAREGRNPGLHFATRLYVEAHPEAAASKLSPLEHYVLVGCGLGWEAPAVTP